MTHEKRYSLCCEALRSAATLSEQEPDALVKLFEADPAIAAAQSYFPILAALAPIMQEAREAMDKGNNSGAVLSALKRIAKVATRDDLHGGWIDDEGRYCVCSGFHAVRLNGARFDSIPTVTGFDGLKKCMERPADLERVELPTVSEVKAHRAAHGKAAPISINGGLKWVDPNYLLDMLQALPGAEAFTERKELGGIWFENDKGDGILLPCRPAKK